MDPLSEFYSRMSFVLFGVAAFGLGQFWSANNLFIKLAAAYPKYYAKIGHPRYNLFNMDGRISAVKFISRLIIGVPKDFPADSKLRLHANLHRAFLILVFIAAIPAAIWMVLPLPLE